MAEKRYYWLKFQENFFEQPKIKILRKIAGGDTFTIIYLKLILLSVKTGGTITLEVEDCKIEEELAARIEEDVENVKVTLNFLFAQKLIESNTERSMFLPDAVKNIGTELSSAKRMRKLRNNEDASQSDAGVTPAIISNTLLSNNRVLLITEQEIKDIFLVLWEEYPVKKSNVQALKTLTNKLSGLTLDEAKTKSNKIWSLMKEYITECEEDVTFPKYVKHFSTWLNAEVPDQKKASGATTKRGAK